MKEAPPDVAKSVADQLLTRLIRAALSGRAGDHLAAHREAYRLGEDMVAPLVARIERDDWSRMGPRGSMAVLSALWLLLHDLDEDSSSSLAETLWLRGELHPIYAQRLMTITAFTLSDYLRSKFAGVSVFTLRALPEAPEVAEQVATWLRGVPAEHLCGIDRLYVSERTQDRFWGEYLRVLANIVLVWRGKNWLSRLLTELTLYHEIGHHVDPDLDAPTPDREAFADRFAFDRFAAAHPRLTHPVLRGVTGPFFFGSRWRAVRGSQR